MVVTFIGSMLAYSYNTIYVKKTVSTPIGVYHIFRRVELKKISSIECISVLQDFLFSYAIF